MEIVAPKLWIEGLNRGDTSAADSAFAADCVIHINGSPEPNLSVNAFKQMIAGLLAAFPDLRITIEDQFVAGDKVTTRWTAEGTHGGALGPVPATGPAALCGSGRGRENCRTMGTVGSNGYAATAWTRVTAAVKHSLTSAPPLFYST